MKKYPRPAWTVIDRGEDGFAAQIGHIRIIASWGKGWEHVSVSTPTRCPTWTEMETIARHFWPDETAMQLHVPESDHINCRPYCLHWWRPTGQELPRPPGWMVGPQLAPRPIADELDILYAVCRAAKRCPHSHEREGCPLCDALAAWEAAQPKESK